MGLDDEKAISELMDGVIRIPLPVYFTLGSDTLPAKIVEKLSSSGNEVCENLYYLGKHSTTKTSEGLRIVTLGGILDPAYTGVSEDDFFPFHAENDVKALKGANSADILITTHWPTLIR